MSSELLIPLLAFTIAASFTPGPNLILITASGANFGFRRTIPHMLGIVVGFPVMTIAVGLGLGEVFKASSLAHQLLKYVGSAYLLYLAYRVAVAGRTEDSAGIAKPFTFLQAAAFQWVNPKAWLMVIGAISTFTTVGGDPLMEVLVITIIFGLMTLPSVGLWALFGVAIRRLLRSNAALHVFNLTMALLLAASVVLFFV
jgi:threonine/homoserine/homoserine lactone efflux protein